MTRTKLVTALSIIFIIKGLWDIGVFFYPLSVSSQSLMLNLTPLISGILGLYVGFQLLRLNEFGRKLAIALLYIRVAINSYFIVWFLSHREGVVSSGLYFLDEAIFHIANPYASEVFLFGWIVLALLAIVFLSQGETTKIFTAVGSKDSNGIVESR